MVRLRMGETEVQSVEVAVGGASQQQQQHPAPQSSAKALLPRAVLALVEYCESPVTSLHATACSCLNLMFQVVQIAFTKLSVAMRYRVVLRYESAPAARGCVSAAVHTRALQQHVS
jgi:hypothetical protein